MAEPRDGSVARRIAQLWDDERCRWRLAYDDFEEDGWRVALQWESEGHNLHEADLALLTWEFYGNTPEEAMADAVKWLEAMDALPIRHGECKECGYDQERHDDGCSHKTATERSAQ